MNFVLILHIFGMILGLGGATYTDLLTFSFAKDFYISKKEADVIKLISKIILFGIVISIITGVILFVPESERLMESPKFLVKLVAFVVLVINGAFLHQRILPNLVGFSVIKDKEIKDTHLSLRRCAFISGAVSVVSWYTVFIIAMIQNMPFDFVELLLIYAGVLVLGIAGALFIEKSLIKKYETR